MIKKIIALLFLVGCSNHPYRGDDVLGAREFVLDSYLIQGGKGAILEYEGHQIEPLPKSALEEYPDLIQNNDVLAFRLFHPEKRDVVGYLTSFSASGFQVEQEKLLLPGLEPIEVAGLTLREAQDKIEKAYSEEVKGVQVFLSYKEREHNRVELAGLTAIPFVPVNGKIRLFEVLSMAKVPTDANLFKSYLVRGNQLLNVDFEKLVREGDMSQNVVMRPQDKIYIANPAASNVYVMGEVKKEGALPILGGAMTLKQALAQSGGIAFTGDKAFIQVIRGNLTKPKIYTLTWNHIVTLPNDALLLIPGDIVYVAATPITQWNRFVNQLFPSFTMYEFFKKGISGVIIE